MAIKFLGIAFIFALIVITPVHFHYRDDIDLGADNIYAYTDPSWVFKSQFTSMVKPEKGKGYDAYLWMYVVFVYVFTGLAVYLLISETEKIIRIRQHYLGHQSTITDRTIRLSGIPKKLKSEDRIKEYIEALEVGKVESVTLCRNWGGLDDLMDERAGLLRKLEEAWTVHLGYRRVERSLESLPITQPPPPEPIPAQEADEESSALLEHGDGGQNYNIPYARERPRTRVRYGFLSLKSKRVDAIDLFEGQLKRLDEKIKILREKEFEPTALAFVTMDSVSACQTAVQAILDPSPTRLVAQLAPAPSDVVWPNTYLPTSTRMLMSWSVTFFIILLTIFWVVPVSALAPFLNLKSIKKIWPQLADLLSRNELGRSMVNTVLPTAILSLLNAAVPYLYECMISQGDVELSVISKNFFFTFFNLFIIFTITGTAASYYSLLRDSLKDTTKIAYLLATSLGDLSQFYVNLIVLQGIGLLPLRLLEFGSVALYPLRLIGAKTPRGKLSLSEIAENYYYGRTFEPLTKYIALGSILLKGAGGDDIDEVGSMLVETASEHTIDEIREEGLHYVNPSLVIP
ncbi:hypothetical protein GP486_004468, partial [Trichoglossum hirsutum]